MKVIIAGDECLFLDGLCFLIHAMYPASHIEQVNSWHNVRHKLQSDSWDLVIVNHTLETELPWYDEFKRLMAVASSCRICMIADTKTKHYIMDALKLGMSGVVLKNANTEQIKRLIDSAVTGKLYLPDDVWRLFEIEKSASNDKDSLLTRRQIEVLSLVLEGNSNRSIANFLFIREGTVKQHLNNIYKALSVKNRAEALYAARELNLFNKSM